MKRLSTAIALLALSASPALAQARTDVVTTAVNDGRFTVLAQLLQSASLDGLLAGVGNDRRWTVFAPTDAAFAQVPPADLAAIQNDPVLLTQVLTYHVVQDGHLSGAISSSAFVETVNGQRAAVSTQGQSLAIDQANVTQGDILCTNGVIHVLDAVLLPVTQNLVEVAAGNANFSTLVAALQATGLDASLAQPGPFTVFAPDDAAFGMLAPGLVQRLLLPGNLPILANILGFHVVPGRLYADDVIAAGSLTTLQGQDLTVTVVGSDVFVEGVRILAADVQTSNGVIHVIEEVLLP